MFDIWHKIMEDWHKIMEDGEAAMHASPSELSALEWCEVCFATKGVLQGHKTGVQDEGFSWMRN